ncbi:unnamed protein product [Absidia cylindrospora]
MNKKRVIDAVDKKDRAKCGAKVDILFRCEGSTKEMKDGRLKQPKVLEDMLYALATEEPWLTSKLTTIGITIMGSKMSLMQMTAPEGYVARVSRTKSFAFPAHINKFTPAMEKSLTASKKSKYSDHQPSSSSS